VKPKCPICGSRSSPHRRGEALRLFSNALHVLALPGDYAHPSCLIGLLKVRYNTNLRRGLSTPRQNINPSQLIEEITSER
jgi:hypothetical protein